MYCFVIDGKILKIGKTDTTMAKRVQSYNCGKKAYRENGTCSTTNYNILQSFLAINKEKDGVFGAVFSLSYDVYVYWYRTGIKKYREVYPSLADTIFIFFHNEI